MAKRYYKIELEGYGGEHAMGFVTDKKEIEALKKLAEDGEVGWYNEVEDEEDGELNMDCWQYDDILHVCSTSLEESYLTITEIEKRPEDFGFTSVDVEIKELAGGYRGYSTDNANTFTLRNPYISDYSKLLERDDITEDSLILGGYTFDKGVGGEYVVETEGEFDIKNLYFGVCNLDESLGINTEIIDALYYITPEAFFEYVDKLSKDESYSEDFRKDCAECVAESSEWFKEGTTEWEDNINDHISDCLCDFIVDGLKSKIEGNEFDGDDISDQILTEFKVPGEQDGDSTGKSCHGMLFDIKGNVLQEESWA